MIIDKLVNDLNGIFDRLELDELIVRPHTVDKDTISGTVKFIFTNGYVFHYVISQKNESNAIFTYILYDTSNDKVLYNNSLPTKDIKSLVNIICTLGNIKLKYNFAQSILLLME